MKPPRPAGVDIATNMKLIRLVSQALAFHIRRMSLRSLALRIYRLIIQDKRCLYHLQLNDWMILTFHIPISVDTRIVSGQRRTIALSDSIHWLYLIHQTNQKPSGYLLCWFYLKVEHLPNRSRSCGAPPRSACARFGPSGKLFCDLRLLPAS